MAVFKVVTVYNPHAMFIAWTDKRIETRGWEPYPDVLRPGEILMIHAGTHRLTKRDKAFYMNPLSEVFSGIWKRQQITDLDKLPYGAIVAACYFRGAFPVDELRPTLSVKERMMGDYSKGRYGWKLELIRAAEKPIPVKGDKGIWLWEGTA